MLVTLGAGGLLAGVACGMIKRPGVLCSSSLAALAAFYAATLMFTDAHSVLGDVAVIAVAGVPVAAGAVCGFYVGNAMQGFTTRSG